jgi:hypothetical protein
MGRMVSFLCIAALACGVVAAVAGAVDKAGTKHADRLVGTKAGDVLKGLRGPDTLIGGAGSDVLIGGKGPDVLRGGPGRDSFNMRDGVALAAPGRDKIDARDGGNDAVNCGAGRDIAIVDSTEDGVFDCEVVRQP